MANTDRLDIILFGATGFTGKRTIPQLTKLIRTEKLSLTWGVAGRSEKKLKEALLEMEEKTGEDYSKIPIICADVEDAKSLEKMTAGARIIINTVGPYRFFGERVIEACIKSGTNHVDVSGEPYYIELMQLKYHEAAKEKGIYLISACGLDSIPADLGVVFLQKNFQGTLNSIQTYLYSTEEGGPYPGAILHYTTYESAVWGAANWHELKGIRSKLYPERLPRFEPKRQLNRLPFKAKFLNQWCVPFPGADAAIINRTQRYMFETYKQRPIQVQCYAAFTSLFNLLQILIIGALFLVMSKFNFTRNILLKHPKFFTRGLASHEGPTEEKQENTIFHLLLIGEGWRETQIEPTDQFPTPPETLVIAKVSGRNPGYGATSIMLSTSAVLVLTEKDKLPASGGCYTTGAAFGNTSMIEKLNKYGVKFEMDPEL